MHFAFSRNLWKASPAKGKYPPMNSTKPVPVILDTDIGSDIDDTWALAMLLRSPEMDLKLVTAATCEPAVRARIICRLLDVAGRSDVGVGVGLDVVKQDIRHRSWVDGYDLSRYRGRVHADGVAALVRTIMESPRPVTLICIGPLPNVAAALEREPAIARKAHFVGMHGSVYRGYGGSAEVSKEWNVVADPRSCQRVFAADWLSMAITPLDTCGLVRLTGDKYRTVAASRDPLTAAVIENYNLWRGAMPPMEGDASSVLFDTVAVYLGFARDLLEMRRLGVRITDDGYTVSDGSARPVDVAVGWKDLGGFEDLLVRRLAR